MSYIVIEKFGGAKYAIIITGQDGRNKVFDSKADVEAEAADCRTVL